LDQIGAFFREASPCVTLTFAKSQPAYFRASPSGLCPLRPTYAVGIWHQVGNGVRLVLDGTDRSCPTAAIPAVVKAELGVCQRPRPEPDVDQVYSPLGAPPP
jgi:hypothetical protein